jgi:putative DNA primase/helicase
MTGSRDGKITQFELANIFLNTRFGNLLSHINSRFHYYDQGYYHAITEPDVMKHEIMNFLDHQDEKISTSIIKEMYELLAIQQVGERPEPGPLVCLQNGTLNPRTGEILAHSPDHRLFYQLPIVWDREATPPRWLAFLDEIFRDDADKSVKIMVLQEFMGYLLIPETPYHKFLWLIGGGANGKSVLISIMEALVGRENVSHAQTQRLDKACVRAELEGKLLNVSSEMSPEATLPESYLKQIVGGDLIEAERKYERPFSFRPFCKLVGATNELPRLLDTTHGFARRAIMIKFNRRFDAHEQNPQLTQELLEELPGILFWAVEGLHRLHEQSGFTVVTSSTEMVAEYQTESDPVRLFLDERGYVADPNGSRIVVSELYSDFQSWAEGTGFQKMNISNFGKRLVTIGVPKVKLRSGRSYLLRGFREQPSIPLNPDGTAEYII